MANRIETAAELVAKLLKQGKTEAQILAETSGDAAIRAAIQDAKAAERAGGRTIGRAVAETPDFARPIAAVPPSRVTPPRAAPPATPSVSPSAPRLSADAPALPQVEGGLFSTKRPKDSPTPRADNDDDIFDPNAGRMVVGSDVRPVDAVAAQREVGPTGTRAATDSDAPRMSNGDETPPVTPDVPGTSTVDDTVRAAPEPATGGRGGGGGDGPLDPPIDDAALRRAASPDPAPAPQPTAFDPNAMGAKKAQIEASERQDQLKRDGFFERRHVFRIEAKPENVAAMSETQLHSLYARVTGFINNSFNPATLGEAGETFMDAADMTARRAQARAAGVAEDEIAKIGPKKTNYFSPEAGSDASGFILSTKTIKGEPVPQLLEGVDAGAVTKADVLKVFENLGEFGIGKQMHIHPADWSKVKSYVDQRVFSAGMGRLLSAVDGSERMGTSAVTRSVAKLDDKGEKIGDTIINDPSQFDVFASSVRALNKIDELAVPKPGQGRTYNQIMESLADPAGKISVEELDKIRRGLQVDQTKIATLRQNIMLSPDAGSKVKAFDEVEAIANQPVTLLGEPLLSANAARSANVEETFARIRKLEQVHPEDFNAARKEAYTPRFQELLGQLQSSPNSVGDAGKAELNKLARAMGVVDQGAATGNIGQTLDALSGVSGKVSPASLQWLTSGHEAKYRTAIQNLTNAADVPGSKIDVRGTLEKLNDLRNIPNSPLVETGRQARMSPKEVLQRASAGEPIDAANWRRMSKFMERHHDNNKKGLSGWAAKLDVIPDGLSIRRAVEYNTSVGSTRVSGKVAILGSALLLPQLVGGINVNDDPGSLNRYQKTAAAIGSNPIDTIKSVIGLDPTAGTSSFTDSVLENMNTAEVKYGIGSMAESDYNHSFKDKDGNEKPFGYARQILSTYLLEDADKGKLLEELSPQAKQVVIDRISNDNFRTSAPNDVAAALRMYTAQHLLSANGDIALAAQTKQGFLDLKAKNDGSATAQITADRELRSVALANQLDSSLPARQKLFKDILNIDLGQNGEVDLLTAAQGLSDPNIVAKDTIGARALQIYVARQARIADPEKAAPDAILKALQANIDNRSVYGPVEQNSYNMSGQRATGGDSSGAPSSMSSAFKNAAQFEAAISDDILFGFDANRKNQIMKAWKDTAVDGVLEPKDKNPFESKLSALGLDRGTIQAVAGMAMSPP